ncbi:MAG: TenA family transcriptional regulator [Gemmatimonadetes bacterium]|nr:TenA family transcriptional regulator [Gemmatimonadota bacterium]
MRSPRRIRVTPEMAAAHDLSTDPPPPDALFWTLWNACSQIAQQALETPYIQGIRAGTLDPTHYGAFNVSDAYYCFRGADDYKAVVERTADPRLRAFLKSKYDSYLNYNATFPKQWRVRDPASIVPFDICHDYCEFESAVAANDDPIYTLVAMLPCEYLWPWLASQLPQPAPTNLYASWVADNLGFGGAYAIGNFLESYRTRHPGSVDPAKATEIYTQAMNFEHQNFTAATS